MDADVFLAEHSSRNRFVLDVPVFEPFHYGICVLPLVLGVDVAAGLSLEIQTVFQLCKCKKGSS